MLSESILNAVQYQANHEIQNFYLYKNFANVSDYLSLTGAQHWFEVQAEEEKTHFEKFNTYLCDQGHVPHLLQIPEIKPEIFQLEEMFRLTVEIEMQTTAYLKQLASLCKGEGDDQTYYLVLDYLKEQVEETKLVSDTHRRVIMSSSNLIVIDQELAKR